MKNIVILFTILLFSQMAQSQTNDNSFNGLWEGVEKYEQEALTKSALKLVKNIYEKAKKEDNSPQIVKALLYSSKYAIILEEDAQLKIINDFKIEITKAKTPTKNILESYLAGMYWQYFQSNRYQFYNRTKTETKVDSLDFRSWDLNTIFNEIRVHFEASLVNADKLKTSPVADYATILNLEEGSEEFRPSLFDLLAHAALEFYSSSENSITRPKNKVELNQGELLCEASNYTQLALETEDTTSLKIEALRIYQELLVLHMNSSKPYALAKADIQRLQFTYKNATFEQKTERYIEVLQNSINAVKGSLAATLYTYELASLYNSLGQTYSAKNNEEYRGHYKKALELCESVIAEAPTSIGADNCKALKSQILAKSLEITAEKHIPTSTTSRLLVSYRNHENLEFTARKVSAKDLKKLNELYPQEKKSDFIKKLPIEESWNVSLKNEQDYQRHQTEIAIPPLKNGRYIIFAAPKNKEDQSFSYADIQATNFALVASNSSSSHSFQVINRDNGAAIAGAKLQLSYLKNYNKPYLQKSFITDNMGMVNISLTKEYWSDVKITVNKDGETAEFEGYQINQAYDPQIQSTNYSCFLFTDRSIYRPGQPLYFKGIALSNNKTETNLIKNEGLTIELRDANYQVVESQDYTTNEYGSFTGDFILPNNGLTGNFSLHVTSKNNSLRGNQNVSVEEYKRPKFETYFEPITGSFKVNDSVSLQAKAVAYAGSNITEAKVSYRVSRSVYFPRWYYWYRPYLNTTPQEIGRGDTQTDANGNYEIKFKALADNSVSKENLPSFHFDVTADVTDINGETHSTTTRVVVGYHSITAKIQVKTSLNKQEKENSIRVSTTNLNGQVVDTKGVLKMYKLIAPQFVLRPRPWPSPDYKGFSETEFKALFPNDAYDNEDDSKNWKKGKLVWQANFDTSKATEIALGAMRKWESGKYLIELNTQDAFEQPVKDIIETTLFSDEDNQLADKQLFKIKQDKDQYAIGEKVKVTLMSAAKNLEVSVFIEKEGKLIDTRLIPLNNNSKSFTIPVTQEDLGGFAVSYSFSAFNSFHSGNMSIAVPYPSADLTIETQTFRNKLQPGKEENWSFKVKGPKGEKVTAELLASMYDASLDAFRTHSWRFNPLIRPTYYAKRYSNAHQSFGLASFRTYNDTDYYSADTQQFDRLNWFGLNFNNFRQRRTLGYAMQKSKRMEDSPMAVTEMDMESGASDQVVMEAKVVGMENSEAVPPPIEPNAAAEVEQQENNDPNAAIQIRKNLQETAFFFPQLKTDKEGNVSFNFTTPEALTKWNVQLLAHTQHLESAILNLESVTQKELMVLPNAPRFLREGDKIVISSKIANLTKKQLNGTAKLELTDGLTGLSLASQLFVGLNSETADLRNFEVDSMGNTNVSWNLSIPEGIQAVQYIITAKADDFSDGEQNLLPVLTNRMLVTETLPMWVRSNQTKTFTLDKLKNVSSATLRHHKLSLEITSNPAWYAVQALPYLMEYPFDCNEQTFSRYYANSLASHIANANPRIKEVFKQWANSDALLSNLEKNQELKSLLIQETPWLRDAQSETEQKKRIALLFNIDKMKNEQANALQKLKQNQKSNGAWPWFKGGPDNRYITQHIITGLGHLKQLTAATHSKRMEAERSQSPMGNQDQMIQSAVAYLDQEFVKEYNRMKKFATNLKDDHLSATQIHYLYMRSFFKDIKTSKKVDEISSYYRGQAQKYWMKRGLYAQAMLSLILHRADDSKTALKILQSLEENSITSEELGMYWKSNTASWYWYQAPIETQSLMIEAFDEIKNDVTIVDNLKIWLLKNKQTNQWKTTKATTEAVYALLLQGSDWLSVTDAVDVLIGGEKIEPATLENVKVEAGTGYYKTSWNGSEVQTQMAEVQLSKKGAGIAWGALYWQYFEDLDKITTADTPLKLKKKLFLKKNTDTGEELAEISEQTSLKLGDLVRVRIELRSDRDMEFLHMKDMRAAGFEPINVLSSYKWQDGLGYYESTKDASTNFFFDYLPKGVYVFEYDLRVNNAGEFSNGITSIQSMYAPEFSSHSEGVRVTVDD